MHVTRDSYHHLVTFFCLYIAQAIPMSFFATALQVLMRQDGFSLTQIAMLQTIKLPWVLKFLWSPMVDRHCTSVRGYKRFILASELCYAVLILIAGFLNLKTDFALILLLIVLSLVASGTQDIATDSLAVLSFSGKGRSMVSSMQSMGSFGGSLIGSGVLLLVLHAYGWHVVLPCLAVFVLIAVMPLMLNRHLTIQRKTSTARASKADFIWFFANRAIWRQLGFLLLFYSGIIGILSNLRPYMVDLGYGLKEIGFLSGVIGTGTAFVCAFGAGILVRKIGVYKARLAFAHATLATNVFFVYLSLSVPSFALLVAAIMLLWACYGMCTIVVYTTAMDNVRAGREGTDFTMQTVITHVSSILVAVICGKVADMAGYTAFFATTLILAALSLLYIKIFFKKQ